jgi:hypothetical membrane protein
MERMSNRSTLLSTLSRHAAWLAALCFLVVLLAFAAGVDGYSHRVHPVALLGGSTMPSAWAFNLFGFVVPGLLVAWLGWRLREALDHASRPARWPARVGAQLLQVSALAFAAQGVLPLDLSDLENTASARHAAAWMIWWLSFAVGGALLAVGLRSRLQWRHFAAGTLLVALALPLCALVLPHWVPAGFAQRAGLVLWFAWAMACARRVNRSAASLPGSTPRG